MYVPPAPHFTECGNSFTQFYLDTTKMPGDLNLKKSWNPALMKNQKKIWEREQDALKEHQAIKRRAKEITQEKEREEMIKLQYGNDLSKMPQKQRLEISKLGWMYTDAPKETEDENGFKEVEEDFLENTAQVEQLLQGNRPAVQSMTSRFDKVASVGAGRAGSSLSDDPLLLIRKQQRAESHKRERSPSRDPKSTHVSLHRGSHSRSDGERSHRHSRGSSDKSERHRERHRSRSGKGHRDYEKGEQPRKSKERQDPDSGKSSYIER